MMCLKTIAILLLTLSHFTILSAQTSHTSEIPSSESEKWWGGFVGLANQMPFEENTRVFDLATENFNNQNVPLMISSAGRYIWSDSPFSFQMKDNVLVIHSDTEQLEAIQAGKTLKDAYLAAAGKHFPSNGTIPEEIFFSQPQYNTWIELMYNQNQEDILKYAKDIVGYGFPPGILMIDDNWQRYYGNFDFRAEKFEDPKAMIDQLHAMGFKVMLWICPFYSADTPEFREMQSKGYLVKDKNESTAIIRWWNGYSACLDTTNPDAVEYFKSRLKELQREYGVDGYKFDAGDVAYMKDNYVYHDKTANQNTFAQRWAEMALDFPYNELRTTWKTGGLPLVQRLGDKRYSWNSNKLLIPGMTTAGLLGFAYTCPDMIGGGEYKSFLNLGDKKIDEELIVRSCQIHALMPMMQFSVAPWRVLSKENVEICARYAKLHEQMGEYILACARHSAATNEPIVRNMEYQYPHQGFIDCNDQFMLGDKYLIAPMVTKGNSRSVKLPKGRWKDDLGKTHKGGKSITIEVPLGRLPYFESIN